MAWWAFAMAGAGMGMLRAGQQDQQTHGFKTGGKILREKCLKRGFSLALDHADLHGLNLYATPLKPCSSLLESISRPLQLETDDTNLIADLGLADVSYQIEFGGELPNYRASD